MSEHRVSLFRRFEATLGAAFVAPALTTLLLSLGALVFDVIRLSLDRGENDVAGVLLEGAPYILAAPLVGIVFGFLGAVAFLGCAFVAAARMGVGPKGYMVAGGAAGLAHTLAGAGMAMFASHIPDPVLGPITWVGGFILAGARPLVVAVPAILSGVAAGFTYARLIEP